MSIQNSPIWLLALVTILIVLLSIEGGYRSGLILSRRYGIENDSPLSVISGAVFGLLAFLLAFTFGILYNRFDARKELVRQEANAIGTTFLRTDFIPEPDRTRSVNLLKEYLNVRIDVVQTLDLSKMPKAMMETDRLQRQLWKLAVVNARLDMNSDVASLYVASLNEVIDIHSLRLARGYQARTSPGLWFSLYALLLLSMFLIGYQIAMAGSGRSPASIILAISFTVVFILIAALDRPQEGFFKVSQQPLISLRLTMEGGDVITKDVFRDDY